ncbi:MAG: hypothetical protein L0226_05080 [Acidobacteria bacterium]|nr:hypothetical protein [Acidobacteriota bacterium]MCI0665813.1 hypothetical protein [Acidobacteriota bacterium]
MISSFIAGILHASRSWKMILLLLVANILFSMPLALSIFLLVVQTASGTLAADRMLANKIDASWIIDVFNHQMPGYSLESVGIQLGLLLAVTGFGYLVVNTLFAGGIIEVFAFDDGRFTMRKFWAGCGAYFWRFVRLLLISLIFYGVAYFIYLLARGLVNQTEERATAYESVIYKRWAVMLLLVVMFAFINMVFDYAKISTVISDSRKMFRETINAFRFALQHFFSTFGLYLLIAIIGISFFGLLAWLRSSINQSSAMSVLLAIILSQAAIAVRMWTRLTFYVAELDLYQRLVPEPATIIAPRQPAEVEFLSATRTRPEEETEEIRGEEAAELRAPVESPPEMVTRADGEGKENI